jgi:uncharacterized protein YndB with AHSA1/START domain
MSDLSTHHATFVIERTYAASPARVFNAWADPAAKLRWFGCHNEENNARHELDFRVGGRELLKTGPASGPVHAFDAHYQDIVPGRRIIYSYDLRVDEKRISVSLATVELEPAGSGTRLKFTEHVVFLDGNENAVEREEGTREGFDRLDAALLREPAAA